MSAPDLFGELAEPEIRKSAHISDCGLYRYRLERIWGPEHALPFIMLNPSTADADIDDPTIRRCMGFARREGAGGIVVGNLYAFRATNPHELRRADDAFGPKNQDTLLELIHTAKTTGVPIVCAWGTLANPWRVWDLLVENRARLVCFGKNASGSPRHPLYVRADQPLEAFP